MTVLERKDPEGYYVLVFNKNCLKSELDSLSKLSSVILEDYSGNIIVKTKSRRIASKLFKKFVKCMDI